MTELPPNEGQNPLRDTGIQRRSGSLEPDLLQSPWRGDWGHEAGAVPAVEPPVKRERLFSRKVIIGCAAATLILYFTAHMVWTAIKESVRESVRTSTAGNPSGSNARPGRVVILLPNGKRITIDKNGAEVSLPEAPPVLPAPKVEGAPAATPAVPAPKGTDLPAKTQKR